MPLQQQLCATRRLVGLGRASSTARRLAVCLVTVAAATVLVACGGPSGEELRAEEQTSDDAAGSGDEQPGMQAPTVEGLAAMSPLDLIVDIGKNEQWIARYNGGAGVEVTPDNWAEVFAIDEQTAAAEVATAQRDGLEAAAAESWLFQPTSSIRRLTIRRYTSLLEVEDRWWDAFFASNDPPPGLTVPEGMQLACRPAYDPDSGLSRVREGEYYADCVVTIGDKIIVELFSTGPDDVTATAGAVGGITSWLEGVMQPGD